MKCNYITLHLFNSVQQQKYIWAAHHQGGKHHNLVLQSYSFIHCRAVAHSLLIVWPVEFRIDDIRFVFGPVSYTHLTLPTILRV